MMRAARQSCRICLNSLAFWKSVPDEMARVTGLEPATSGVTGRHSNRLSYTRAFLWAALRRAASLCAPERWVKRGTSGGFGYFLLSDVIHATQSMYMLVYRFRR